MRSAGSRPEARARLGLRRQCPGLRRRGEPLALGGWIGLALVPGWPPLLCWMIVAGLATRPGWPWRPAEVGGPGPRQGDIANPDSRYEALSELVADLDRPNPELVRRAEAAPLLEKNPTLFWKLVSLALAVLLVLSLALG